MVAPTLLTIPTEIRLLIFKYHFRSTTIRKGLGTTCSRHSSLLSTCRQIHHEAKPLLIPNVSFRFTGTAAMIECLTTLSHQQIQEIRYIEVMPFPFPIRNDMEHADVGPYTVYPFADILPLFPGLQLSRLEIEDFWHLAEDLGRVLDVAKYESLESLLVDRRLNKWLSVAIYQGIESLLESDGWRELCFVTASTKFMSSTYDKTNVRVEQPIGWNRKIQNRDGEGSGACVMMFIANNTHDGLRGDTDGPGARTPYTVVPGHLNETSNAGNINGASSTAVASQGSETDASTDPAVKREVLLIARRGKNASYVQDGSKLKANIRNFFSKWTWLEMKEGRIFYNLEADLLGHP